MSSSKGQWLAGVLLVASVWSAACSGARNRRQSLHDAVHSYATAIRWGHVQKASRFVPAKDKAAFIAQKRRAYQRMRVHEVELRAVSMSTAQDRARVQLSMAFSVGGNPVIKHHLIEQLWRHGRGGWVVVKRRRVEGKAPAPSQPGDLY